MKQTSKKKILIGAGILVALIAVMAVIFFVLMPKSTQGLKALDVTVVFEDSSSKDFAFKTDAEFLRGALEEQKLIEGTESEYGLFVLTVDGVTADDAKQQWWAFSKDGEMLMTGVDATPIADGEHYEITLTTGY